MINFNSNSSTTAESFKKKSEKILGVFTKTKEDLVTLNKEQAAYVDSVISKISELEAERLSAAAAISENQSIIQKIEDFLS